VGDDERRAGADFQAGERRIHALEDLGRGLPSRRPLELSVPPGLALAREALLHLLGGEAAPCADVALPETLVDPDRSEPEVSGDQVPGPACTAEIGGDRGCETHIAEARSGRRGLTLARLGQRNVGPALPATLGVPDRLGVAEDEDARHEGSVNHPVDIIRGMSRPPVLVSVELRFKSAEDPEQLAERIRESVRLIVGNDALEDFRVRSLPLTPPSPEPR
jgi:hypothetical protein